MPRAKKTVRTELIDRLCDRYATGVDEAWLKQFEALTEDEHKALARKVYADTQGRIAIT